MASQLTRRKALKSYLGWPLLTAFLITMGACSRAPETSTNHTVALCIDNANWGRLEPLMRTFGARHSMQFHGEFEPAQPSAHLRDHLNYALIRGMHQFAKDDFDLWLVSDPSTTRNVFLNVLSRRALSANERETEGALLEALQPLECGAPKSGL